MRARRRRRGRWGPGGRGYGPGRGVSRSHGRIGPTDRSGGGGRRRWGGDGGRRIRRGRHACPQVPRGSKRLRRSGWRAPPPRVPLPSGPALLEEGGEVAPVRWQGSDLPASRRTIARAPVGSAVPGGCREKGDRGSESDGRRSSRRGGSPPRGAPRWARGRWAAPARPPRAFKPAPVHPRMDAAEPSRAAEHLGRADARWASLIQTVGLRGIPRARSGFPGLARSIIFQQISGAAGNAIWRRVVAAGGRRSLPPAAWFLAATPETLRAAGLSPQKIGYLKDLAARVVDGRLRLPPLKELPDAEVVRALTEVRGIGPWTAQMYLLFRLGRPDVLPTGDLGLRKALQQMHGLRRLPSERQVERMGRAWAPYRSYATYYLWRSLEQPPRAPPRPRKRAPTAASNRSANPRRRPPRAPRGGGATDRKRRRSRPRGGRPSAPPG